jgi:hypothetical protein
MSCRSNFQAICQWRETIGDGRLWPLRSCRCNWIDYGFLPQFSHADATVSALNMCNASSCLWRGVYIDDGRSDNTSTGFNVSWFTEQQAVYGSVNVLHILTFRKPKFDYFKVLVLFNFFLFFCFCFVSFFKSKTVTQTRITVLFHFVFSFTLPAGSYSLFLLAISNRISKEDLGSTGQQ